eukprot:gnl/TRDRNA2_/TRDRNA2_34198_c0_seq1.p1 gnl/TRDRNA2_/TRDRNA2_34198_c0~~gnl/TRDRNA2_/TRDRNA2_34198_c0_seq1.p1  ORF type:complete len:224 (-),score=39.69 gnl/TRDRNA2_/TRDRNA2_34198_c0_seq1:466-1137(-)
MKVTVTTIQGEDLLSEHVDSSLSVLQLKKRLQELSGFPFDAMKLIWNSVILQPNHAELSSLVGKEAQELTLVLVRLAARRVYFQGIAWMGTGAEEVTAGVSARHAEPGTQLSNAADQDPFLRHAVDAGVKFESITHPGLFISVDGTRVVLGEPDGEKEMFSEVPARNGAAEPCVTLQSCASPDSFLVHCNGEMYCHSLANKMQYNMDIFNNDATWRLCDCEED